MITLFPVFTIQSFINLALSLVTIGFGWPMVLALLDEDLKTALLSNDTDGKLIFVIGIVVFIAGLAVPDFAFAYALVMIGMITIEFGAFIAASDFKTEKMFAREWAKVYMTVALTAFVVGAMSEGSLGYTAHGFLWLALPIGLASGSVYLAIMAMSSNTFKERVLTKDLSGKKLLLIGLITLCLAPIAYQNPAMMVSVSALAFVWISLGGVIWMNPGWTKFVLHRWMAIVQVLIAVALVIVARINY